MRANKDILFHTFTKKHCERKLKNLPAPLNAYVSSISTNENKIYENYSKGPKMMWVPKVNTQAFITKVIYSLKC